MKMISNTVKQDHINRMQHLEPYTAIHGSQNPSACLIMLLETLISACYLSPAGNKGNLTFHFNQNCIM